MSPPFLQLSPGEMWGDLSVWMQRREMIDYCLHNYTIDADEAKNLIKLIDVAIRNRIRGILQAVEQENLPAIHLLESSLIPDRLRLPNKIRKRCEKCLHVNRVIWCRCSCHLDPTSGHGVPPS